MPELPEVETVRAQLEPQLVGRRIVDSWARLPRITQPSVAEFISGTRGQRIVAARRRGKQLYFPLENGANLLIHLGMSGQLRIENGGQSPQSTLEESLPRHVHAVLQLDDERRLVFTDPRTFGAVGVARELPCLQIMGPEPIDEDFDSAALAAKLQARKTKIKAAILDQTLVAGLGNIYADEVCFLAGVHPETRACDVPLSQLNDLIGHMKPVLQRAIAARGATLKDGGYQDTFGNFGEYIPHIYGRTGQSCNSCGTSIVRGVLGAGKTARSYHCCPQCQPVK